MEKEQKQRDFFTKKAEEIAKIFIHHSIDMDQSREDDTKKRVLHDSLWELSDLAKEVLRAEDDEQEVAKE